MRTKHIKNFPVLRTALALLVCAALIKSASAQIEVVITQGVHKALPIAVAPFEWQGAGAAPLDIGAVIRADLATSGRFELADTRGVKASGKPGKIDFSVWRARKVDSLVAGSIKQLGANRYRLKVRLFDVHRGKQLTAAQFEASTAQLRKAAHQAGDRIFEKLTGIRGAFNTRIAYVSESLGIGRGPSRYILFVADYDGHNPIAVLRSAHPVLSPAWSPDGKQLAYMVIEKGRSIVYVQQLGSGTRRRIASEKGINGAPAWSPDGLRIALMQSYQGNPEIYVYSTANSSRRRLTNNLGIDTEPAWSPDGKHIVFTSSRSGRPQIYRVVAAGGKAPQRLSFWGGYNAGASYGPNGGRLLLITDSGGSQRVGMLNLGSNDIFTLTGTDFDESPTFAPNGVMFMYATLVKNRSVVYVVSDDGRTVNELISDKRRHAKDPAWSPLPPI